MTAMAQAVGIVPCAARAEERSGRQAASRARQRAGALRAEAVSGDTIWQMQGGAYARRGAASSAAPQQRARECRYPVRRSTRRRGAAAGPRCRPPSSRHPPFMPRRRHRYAAAASRTTPSKRRPFCPFRHRRPFASFVAFTVDAFSAAMLFFFTASAIFQPFHRRTRCVVAAVRACADIY